MRRVAALLAGLVLAAPLLVAGAAPAHADTFWRCVPIDVPNSATSPSICGEIRYGYASDGDLCFYNVWSAAAGVGRFFKASGPAARDVTVAYRRANGSVYTERTHQTIARSGSEWPGDVCIDRPRGKVTVRGTARLKAVYGGPTRFTLRLPAR